MQSIRGRLAVWYAAAMGATLLAFATVIYLVERPASRARLDERMEVEADLIAVILELSPLDPAGTPQGVSVISIAPESDVQKLIQGVPDYVLVLVPEPQAHFPGNPKTQAELSEQELEMFADSARVILETGGGIGEVFLGPGVGQVRYYVRPLTTAGDQFIGVVTGVATTGLILAPRRMLTAMVSIAPLIILASMGIGHVLVGRTLRSVDDIVDEVEAISDGRSLHRRLAPPQSADELGRLVLTLNAMFARLERNFATLRRFTADASHELKTPLTVLRAGIERAITHPQVSPAVMVVLEETLIEVKRMTELVDSLLMLARADEGRAPLHLEQIDLRDMLAEIAETAGILGEQAGVDVSVTAPRREQRISVDRSRLRQLLMNLLTNAIKYTPAGGSVSVESKSQNGTVVIRVKDSGVGIAPGELAHVFDRFWRADLARSRTGQRSGAGLGLAISKWIAEAHGGSIEAQSAPGRGTTMAVTLPVEEER